jgi:hypothetical protein
MISPAFNCRMQPTRARLSSLSRAHLRLLKTPFSTHPALSWGPLRPREQARGRAPPRFILKVKIAERLPTSLPPSDV